jgi:predicted DNA-binding transcriptional regulator AlpA
MLSNAERYKNLSTKQVLEYIGATRRETVWAYVRLGKLPKPRYLRAHRPVWRLGEVLDHLEHKMLGYDERQRGLRGEVAKQAPKALTTAERMRERFGLKR